MTHIDRSFYPSNAETVRPIRSDFRSPASIRYQTTPFYRTYGKRVLDVVLVASSLVMIVPLMLILAIVTMRDGGNPFFGHRRIGQNGVSFQCWKLRTMVVNAEDRLKDHLAANPDAKREWDANFKLENDPRVTKLGHFFRKTRVDELPQFWNVLRGEMSLVGPRPVTAPELDRYGDDLPHYLSQRPGVTGKWQVVGRSDVSYNERVQMDVEYGAECSLKTDIALIAATLLVVVRRTGK